MSKTSINVQYQACRWKIGHWNCLEDRMSSSLGAGASEWAPEKIQT